MAIQAIQNPNMPPAWELRYRMSFGSYNGAPEFTTGIDYELDSPVDSDEHEDNIQKGALVLSSVLLDIVTIKGFNLRQHAHTPTEPGIHRSQRRSGRLNVKGQRELTVGQIAMPANVTVRWPKDVRIGSPGQFELRGCLSTNDVAHDSTGSLVLKTAQVNGAGPYLPPDEFMLFAASMATWEHGKLVMPDSALYVGDYSREIRGIGMPVLGQKQVRNKFKTVEAAEIDYKMRQGRKLIRDFADALSHIGNAATDPSWVARVGQYTKDFGAIVLSLPVKQAAELTIEEGAKKLLALNEAT